MKKVLVLTLLMSFCVCGFAGDGSKESPYSPTDIINFVLSANGDLKQCNFWVESYIGIYTGYTTVFENGTIKTVDEKILILSEEPNVKLSSRNPSQYNAKYLVLVGGGDNWLQDHPDITDAVNSNANIRFLAHCTKYYRSGGQGFNVVVLDYYEFQDDLNGIISIENEKEKIKVKNVISLDGVKVNSSAVKGVNIIQLTDGSIKKIISK